MTTQETTGFRSFEADEAIARDLRVKLDADGKVTIAVAASRHIGTANGEAFAAGDWIAVDLNNRPGTKRYIASKAIDIGDLIYTDAAGKVTDTSAVGNFLIGIAVTAATADGDVIEVAPVVDVTAN